MPGRLARSAEGVLAALVHDERGPQHRAGDDVASDPTPTSSTTPTAVPTVETYPSFEPEDYSHTLVVACFCADGGAPIRVTVVNREVTDAIYTGDGRGTQEGGQPTVTGG